MLEVKKISDYVYDAILKNIVELKYAPGEKISETMLSKELGVSRAPIKTALSKLEAKKLVEIRPQYGTFISRISPERAKNICEIRILLEQYAIREAVKNITDQQVEKIGTIFGNLEQFDGSDQAHRELIYKADEELHELIYTVCGNSIIKEVIEQYRAEIRRIQYANMEWGNRKDSTQEEMREIFEALCARDEERAQKAMEKHLLNIKKTAEALETNQKNTLKYRI